MRCGPGVLGDDPAVLADLNPAEVRFAATGPGQVTAVSGVIKVHA
jgi:hypothetical protein